MIHSLFLYVLVLLKIIYIALVAGIVSWYSVHKDVDDRHFIRMRKTKEWVQMINEVIMFGFIIYLFAPFDKNAVIVSHREKISLFIFALIGLSNVNWNLFLNRIGIHIPVMDLLHFN
jgi:hypothetical protein